MKSDTDPYILPLQGAVQHYAWGGFEFIPELLRLPEKVSEPYAELWIGAHPRGTAHVRTGDRKRPLDELIARRPGFFLGQQVADTFQNELPFLMKILDVRKMLSIQAHPNKEQAERGFQAENDRGIPLDAPHRVFKDRNHKPEVMVALTNFWLLHGFRPAEKISRLLSEVPEFADLQPQFENKDIAGLYRYIMELDQRRVNQLLEPMNSRLKAATFSKDEPEYWAQAAFKDYTTAKGDYDRGIFSLFFFNLVHLEPETGIFQAAGIPHAYLEGVNVELMANSDNVFRGGLTPKHVDVPALMTHLVFDPVHPEVLEGKQLSATERRYPTPAPDFELSRIVVAPGMAHEQPPQPSPHVYIVLQGEAILNGDTVFQRGESFFVVPNTKYRIQGKEKTVLYRAGVPEIS